ncbi:MAG: hypothetical protein IPP50_16465 [Piscinibacter sp.]|nr:hypothetical protein [Piscinibacter sp.]
MNLRPIALLLAVAGATAQAAGPVYRCGSSYSQTPCPGGTQVEAGDPRTAAQRAEARRIAAAERTAARRAEQERLATEKKQRGVPAIASLGPTAASAPARGAAKSAGTDKPPRKAKSKDDKGEPFTAVVPGSRKN